MYFISFFQELTFFTSLYYLNLWNLFPNLWAFFEISNIFKLHYHFYNSSFSYKIMNFFWIREHFSLPIFFEPMNFFIFWTLSKYKNFLNPSKTNIFLFIERLVVDFSLVTQPGERENYIDWVTKGSLTKPRPRKHEHERQLRFSGAWHAEEELSYACGKPHARLAIEIDIDRLTKHVHPITP